MALLVLGFESAHHPVHEPMRIALEVAREHGGEEGEVRSKRPDADRDTPGREAEDVSRIDSVGAWRDAFLAAPYLRDTFVAVGVLSDTFETAITWDRFEEFHATVSEAARGAVATASDASSEGD